ncbi:efflux RND transporter periplasmic adaptor subunit [Galbitalea soli]|uniref:HlyD family efflux transporter periplasmic adaptor subunit n=1 Tax=Galbitalea soli TaxID=1268042 RepID=A0A7C9TRJ2_9MICO|nr:efflux RND transporter periplasmic adaptor subunit [Galbitalea soli]NEM92078.1 HlyD family efflux transporter periplasmic adaptor subunit [Galbitalea soli]NYJ31970.1 macrolide-specific efflux system membrane fusion protein [Galbitalea soli]
MKLSRPVIVNVTLAVVIVAAAVAALLVFNPFASSSTAATTQLTGTVQQGAVSTTITASGSIDPKSEVSVAFAASGTIASVRVALGQTVKKGAVLGTLHTTDLKTALSNAETTLSHDYTLLAAAETAYTAAKTAASSSSSSGGGSGGTSSVSSALSQLYSAQDNVANAAASVKTAEENLADATLRAPISGLVVAVNGAVGGSVSAGTTSSASGASSASGSSSGSGSASGASSSSSSSGSSSSFVTIADTSKYTVTAAIAEADIAQVKVGQAATVSFPAITGASAKATVTAIAPTATASNSVVTYATTITLVDPPSGLRLGQTADVTITTQSSAADALYVPAAAITTSGGVSTVKVVKNGVTTATTVTLGIVGDAGTEITSGLTAGETIVIGSVSATTGTSGTTGTTGRTGFGTGTGGFPGTGTGGFGGTRGGNG